MNKTNEHFALRSISKQNLVNALQNNFVAITLSSTIYYCCIKRGIGNKISRIIKVQSIHYWKTWIKAGWLVCHPP